MDRLIPGLMPEPVPVRVPVRREDRYNRRWWNKKLSVQMKKSESFLYYYFMLLEMYALSDFLIMVYVMVSEAVT